MVIGKMFSSLQVFQITLRFNSRSNVSIRLVIRNIILVIFANIGLLWAEKLGISDEVNDRSGINIMILSRLKKAKLPLSINSICSPISCMAATWRKDLDGIKRAKGTNNS